MEEKLNINRKLSLLKHRKKQAANDAQLLMYLSNLHRNNI